MKGHCRGECSAHARERSRLSHEDTSVKPNMMLEYHRCVFETDCFFWEHLIGRSQILCGRSGSGLIQKKKPGSDPDQNQVSFKGCSGLIAHLNSGSVVERGVSVLVRFSFSCFWSGRGKVAPPDEQFVELRGSPRRFGPLRFSAGSKPSMMIHRTAPELKQPK